MEIPTPCGSSVDRYKTLGIFTLGNYRRKLFSLLQGRK
jgi:hypothetical protein